MVDNVDTSQARAIVTVLGLEVGGATCEQECWELVRVSEETGKFCMLLENCCYADNELMLFHIA